MSFFVAKDETWATFVFDEMNKNTVVYAFAEKWL